MADFEQKQNRVEITTSNQKSEVVVDNYLKYQEIQAVTNAAKEDIASLKQASRNELQDFINFDYRKANEEYLPGKDGIVGLQAALKDVGFDIGSEGPDGVFGPATFRALIDFQIKYGLQPDGIAGPETQKKLYEVSSLLQNADQKMQASESEVGPAPKARVVDREKSPEITPPQITLDTPAPKTPTKLKAPLPEPAAIDFDDLLSAPLPPLSIPRDNKPIETLPLEPLPKPETAPTTPAKTPAPVQTPKPPESSTPAPKSTPLPTPETKSSTPPAPKETSTPQAAPSQVPSPPEKQKSAENTQISKKQFDIIGKKIWQSESEGKIDGLAAWNEGEDFPSLGTGHFIWYKEGQSGKFEESFPGMVKFLKENGVSIPPNLSWIEGKCPWKDKGEFLKDKTRASALRSFLSGHVAEQTAYIKQRLDSALPKMLLQTDKKELVQANFNSLMAHPMGVYVLMDYVNFKGEGTNPSERYKGKGWGLLQVLENMPGSSQGLEAVKQFSESAQKVLTERVANSPPEKGEKRWLAGWVENRVAGYKKTLPGLEKSETLPPKREGELALIASKLYPLQGKKYGFRMKDGSYMPGSNKEERKAFGEEFKKGNEKAYTGDPKDYEVALPNCITAMEVAYKDVLEGNPSMKAFWILMCDRGSPDYPRKDWQKSGKDYITGEIFALGLANAGGILESIKQDSTGKVANRAEVFAKVEGMLEKYGQPKIESLLEIKPGIKVGKKGNDLTRIDIGKGGSVADVVNYVSSEILPNKQDVAHLTLDAGHILTLYKSDDGSLRVINAGRMPGDTENQNWKMGTEVWAEDLTDWLRRKDTLTLTLARTDTKLFANAKAYHERNKK